jgi:hypothetical protein
LEEASLHHQHPLCRSEESREKKTSWTLGVKTKPDITIRAVFINDGDWHFSVITSFKYNIRSAVQIHFCHDEYHVPEGAQHNVTPSSILEGNLDWEADLDASVPGNDLLIRVLGTPDYDLWSIDTLINGWKIPSLKTEMGTRHSL